MAPIFHRRHTLQSFLTPTDVVPIDVRLNLHLEILEICEVLSMEHLRLEMTEEILHDRVVEALTG